MEREKKIKVISGKGWGWWDYKAVVLGNNRSLMLYPVRSRLFTHAHIRPKVAFANYLFQSAIRVWI